MFLMLDKRLSSYPKITLCGWMEFFPQYGQYSGFFAVSNLINWNFILHSLQKNVPTCM